MLKLKKLLLTSAALCSVAAAPLVHAVAFTTTGVSLQVGAGYGEDRSENNGSLLDVDFSTNFAPQTFQLNSVNASQSFTFGSAQFGESNSFGGILASETNNLGVTASFSFANPLGVTKSISAIGSASEGAISDFMTDYTLVFSPVTVDFGTNGKFRIDVSNLSFSQTGTQSLRATITLLALPTTATVPEPTSIALLGLGLMGLAGTRRKYGRKQNPKQD